jgi:hypothetical protein
MDRVEYAALEARLNQLEQRLRATRAAWLISVVVLAVLGMGVRQAASQTEVLRTRGLEIVDAAGVARIVLRIHDDTAEVMVADAQGRDRIWFNVAPDGTPGAVFTDATGVGRLWVTARPERPAGLIFSDGTGRGRVWLGAFSEASTGLVLVDANGKVIFQAP